MSYPVTNVAAGLLPPTGIEELRRPGKGDLESDKQRLRKATKEFEALFTYEMLKTMRKTVPKDSSSEGAGISSDLGKDTFTQMFDMELARKMANGGQGSMADILYNSLERVLEVQHGVKPSPTPVKRLGESSSTPMVIDRRVKSLPLPLRRPIPIHRKEPVPIPVRRQAIDHPRDNILSRFGRYIDEAARQTSLDSSLIHAVIKAESNGDPTAVSSAGARGLMQLTDSTMQDYGVSRAFDPRENILTGSRYLRRLLDRFGDLRLALAAYNAGPQNVKRHHGIPPFEETRAYVNKVMDEFTLLRRATREAKVQSEDSR